MGQPLSGVKVIDLTSALSGPFCTMLLGDLGADVIKVEEPRAGDMNRKWGPFIEGESTYFLYANRNKKCMTLNLREGKGREILIRLIRKADVLVENYRPQVKYRLKIEYDTLKEINPRLVYCSISGFGQTGPWADRPGFDQIAQGMSGLMSVTGFPNSPPTRVGVAIGDSICGIYAAYGILAALLERNRSGLGQYLETSLLEGLISLLGSQAAKYFGTGQRPSRQGNDHATIAPYGTFKTKDGYINIAAATQQMWEKLCRVLNLAHLIQEKRFEKSPDRENNKEELKAILEEQLTRRTSDEWIEVLNDEGIPCGPILNIDQVFQDSQVLHQNMLFELDHPKAGRTKSIGFPVKLNRTPCKVNLPPPCFNQHTAEILQSLGYKEDDIDVLRRDGIISK